MSNLAEDKQIQEALDKIEAERGRYSEAAYTQLSQVVGELKTYLEDDDVGAIFVAGRLIEEIGQELQNHADAVWKRDKTYELITEALREEESKLQKEDD